MIFSCLNTKRSWLHLLHTGDNFGGAAIELAGIIVDPRLQNKKTGGDMVQDFLDANPTDHLSAYTRNPAVLRILGNVARQADVLLGLSYPLANVSIHDNIAYHLDRYGPDGLYGSYDPASREYNGRILKERCVLLNEPGNALAVSVTVSKEPTHE